MNRPPRFVVEVLRRYVPNRQRPTWPIRLVRDCAADLQMRRISHGRRQPIRYGPIIVKNCVFLISFLKSGVLSRCLQAPGRFGLGSALDRCRELHGQQEGLYAAWASQLVAPCSTGARRKNLALSHAFLQGAIHSLDGIS